MKTRQLVLLALAELLAMSVWFSASALVPELSAEWGLSDGSAAWLTMSVQLGFVFGALVSAMFNLADRWPAHRVIALGALLAASANLAIPLAATSGGEAIALRFLTGSALALVYPPGMKIVASWARGDRGYWIGVMVGALAIGSASPHLIGVFSQGGLGAWRGVMMTTSAMTFVSALIAIAFIRPGPFLSPTAPFDWRQALAGLSYRPTRLANLGYFGHMWELYAMWAWFPVLLLSAYGSASWSPGAAKLAAFAVIAAGGISSVLAGRWADRVGRTRVTTSALAVSGACALVAGFLSDHPALLTAVGLLWGFAVVADSAQFSAAVSELTDERYVGTALTVQTSLGFLLTMVTLRLVPWVSSLLGWGPAFMLLAMGPVVGGWAMLRLRGLPEATRMASGNR